MRIVVEQRSADFGNLSMPQIDQVLRRQPRPLRLIVNHRGNICPQLRADLHKRHAVGQLHQLVVIVDDRDQRESGAARR